MHSSQILICGSGIIGLTIARELVFQGYNNILIIEKENSAGLHASGRNSGVLHTGIYYPKESDKAKYCLDGNYLMQEYCMENSLPIKKTGKVIVTKDESQLKTLQMLYERGKQNKAPVELLDEKQLSEVEPRAKTVDKALFSKETSIVDPLKIVQCLQAELIETKKVNILFNTKLIKKIDSHCVASTQGSIQFEFFINAAGAYSDEIAHIFNQGLDYQLIPFKGFYKQLKLESDFQLNTCIYPVPDLENPFLGVHFTKSLGDTVYLGPTATPVFGRENYQLFQGLGKESIPIIVKDIQLFFLNRKFRTIALSEPQKYLNHFFYKDAASLVKEISKQDIVPSLKSGIRPQLINKKTNQLVMDFVLERGENDIHVLNAISPAFTSSMTFAKKIVNLIN